ncbi:thiamine pyrophosphate-binding protein [Candidatus Lucifugimonas marina]|jgi:acetolactate synthase-1/2/3 large subunit|uniref:Thiamine pyrophosphate-binding protein n=1 Tax=Candidatus Lucifugimonas marina TaxID=3038979 RepID=A0AAJ5ZIM6_9CHLR|nr:thiamine pyrophosphate-binding protein [SAR202 cluster bacterium JH702]MDG0868862.1 thiamine pyrophosphate-binding protein [SAR202 cluster bacterium JH639]WFG35490.1 thiamine pyrophosphate-binding protein [SAR202 cluster bacterium JH545]WFG39437.1 thiamine pyrophosphate-binding protein [SAR202 cluster bacterium JH1073]
MAKLSGGEALIKSLVREGVEVIFGLPGVQMYGIVAALRDEPSIKFVVTRNETSTTYMADGYARTTGRPGVAMVVPGPGIYNAGGGLSTAFSRSSPVVLIAGQIPRDGIGKNFGGLHEVNDQKEITNPVTKWQKQVLRPHEVPESIHEAFRQAQSDRPSPVHFELPPETMVEREEVELLEPAVIERKVPADSVIEQAAKEITAARKPVIYAGGGIARSDAEAELVAFAEAHQIAVLTSAGGKGTMSERHALALGGSLGPTGQLKDYIEDADVVIGIGTRFSMRNQAADKARLVHIDADPEMIGHVHQNSLGVVGDVKATLPKLQAAISAAGGGSWDSPAPEVSRIQEALANSEEELNQPQEDYIRALQEGAPDDAIMVFGMTQLGYYSRPRWITENPKSYIDSGYSGNLGFAFPTALGAKVGNPDKPVICVSGDGGFMYNSSEISTAVKYGINLVTVIYNDGHYGNVARDMDDDFGGTYETDFVNPDFVKLAEAYGAVGLRAKDPFDVKNVIPKALAMNKPVFIDVPVSRVPRPKQWSARAPWTTPQDGLLD